MGYRRHYSRWRFFCFFACLLPLLSYAKPLSLSAVVEKALSYSPTIHSRIAIEDASRERIAIAQAGYLPRVSLSLSRGYEWTNTTLLPGNNRLYRQENGVNVTQALFDGLGIYHQIQSEAALTRSEGHSLAASEQEVALAAIEAVLNVLQSERFVILGHENVRKHRETLERVKSRSKAGADHQGESSLVEGRTALAMATLVRLKSELSNAKASYQQVVGELPSTFIKPGSPQRIVPSRLEQALSIAFENSPIIANATAILESSRHQAASAKSPFMPNVSLRVSANNNVNLDGVRGDNRDRMAMLQVSYDLFNGGADLARLREAEARSVDSLAQLQQARRQLREQVTTDWNLWLSARSRLGSLKKHVDASAIVLRAYKNEFKIGRRQIFNVLDQENELFQSKVEYERGLTDVKRSGFRLLASMGKLVDNTLAQHFDTIK